MLFTVWPFPRCRCLPQPLIWPRRPGSGHGSHVGGGGSSQGGSRQSGGGGTGVSAGGGAGGGSGGAPASAAGGGGSSAAAAGSGGGSSAATAAGGGGSFAAATAAAGGEAVLLLLLAADGRGTALHLAAVAGRWLRKWKRMYFILQLLFKKSFVVHLNQHDREYRNKVQGFSFYLFRL